jgi:hypothetical protein
MRHKTQVSYSQDRPDAKLAMEAEKEGFASTQEVDAFIKTLKMDIIVSQII